MHIAAARGTPWVNGLLLVSSHLSCGRMRATCRGRSRCRHGQDEQAFRRDIRRRSASGKRRSSSRTRRQPPHGLHGISISSRSRRGRIVRRIQPLGDDAFEMHAAGRPKHGIACGHEMLDVAEPVGSRTQHFAKTLLARRKRQRPKIVGAQETTDRTRRTPDPPSRVRKLQPATQQSPVNHRASSATTSPSIMPSGSAAPAFTISGNLSDQSRPLRDFKHGAAALRCATASGSRRT